MASRLKAHESSYTTAQQNMEVMISSDYAENHTRSRLFDARLEGLKDTSNVRKHEPFRKELEMDIAKQALRPSLHTISEKIKLCEG